MKLLLVELIFLASLSSFADGARFDVNVEKQNIVKIESAKQCRTFLTRLSWKAETSTNFAEITEIMSTVRLFKDNIAASICPVQEFNSSYLILKMDELIGYDSHPGTELKSFSEIRTVIQQEKSL